jgi:hypothetical protein
MISGSPGEIRTNCLTVICTWTRAGLSQGASTLLVLMLVLVRLVLVGRLVWLLLVLVNLHPHYFSCSPGFGAWGSVYLLVVCIGCSTSTSNVDGPSERELQKTGLDLTLFARTSTLTLLQSIGFEVLTTLTLKGAVFCNITPCSLVEVDRYFEWRYCLHIQGGRVSQARNKTSAGLHSITFHKIGLFVV